MQKTMTFRQLLEIQRKDLVSWSSVLNQRTMEEVCARVTMTNPPEKLWDVEAKPWEWDSISRGTDIQQIVLNIISEQSKIANKLKCIGHINVSMKKTDMINEVVALALDIPIDQLGDYVLVSGSGPMHLIMQTGPYLHNSFQEDSAGKLKPYKQS